MAAFRHSAVDRAVFAAWTLVAALTTYPIASNACPGARTTVAAANQAAGSDDQTPPTAERVKPGADGAPPSGKPAADPNAARPPLGANVDARELVKRRMELCRQRPEICVQKGGSGDEGDKRPPEGTSKD